MTWRVMDDTVDSGDYLDKLISSFLWFSSARRNVIFGTVIYSVLQIVHVIEVSRNEL